MLNPTPEKFLTDSSHRPYFLWDCDLTLEEFKRGLVARALGWSAEETDAITRFRDTLIEKLLSTAAPE